jgi:two-component system phosphate regulon sensor histidine kinase PhoR
VPPTDRVGWISNPSYEARRNPAGWDTRYEWIKDILGGLADPILAIDDDDEVALANPSAEALFGADAATSENRALARLLHCQKLVDLLTATSHRKAADARTDEIEILDAQGQSRWYRVTVARLPAAAGDGDDQADSAGAVAVLRDIGDQKAIQRRNAEFVSAVSHEMKTPLAGIKAYVELLADGDAEDDQTRFEVEDTGVGLSEEDCQRVFEKFYRVAKDKSMASGTGLGLPLARHIVEDVHGGSLTATSVLGKGSTFIATLPNAGQMS